MKVLVTGGCGFLGSHVCELFKKKGWDVVAYDNMSKYELGRTGYNVEAARDYNRQQLEAIGIGIQKADVTDFDCLLQCAEHSFAEGKVDYIIHTAAQPAMTIALEYPLFDADVNVKGAINVLEVARRLNVPVAICSTIHIYGNGINAWTYEHMFEPRLAASFDSFDEDTEILTGSLTPLHVSKRASELYARAYVETHGCRVATFRLTGIYGPGQLGGEDHGWVANFAIRTVLERPIKVFGTDLQVRDILYVKDAAQAFWDWYTNGQTSGVYNIGGGVGCITSIKQCLQMLSHITDKKQNVELLPERKGDLWYFCCNTEKAQNAFGWKSTVLPWEGIGELVDWIHKNKELFQ